MMMMMKLDVREHMHNPIEQGARKGYHTRFLTLGISNHCRYGLLCKNLGVVTYTAHGFGSSEVLDHGKKESIFFWWQCCICQSLGYYYYYVRT